jgi:hypothetical protein
MGVKNSSSDLFINNCDEFIYYDDIVRKEVSEAAKTRQAAADDGKKKPATEGDEAKKKPADSANQAKKSSTGSNGEQRKQPAAEPKKLDPKEALDRLKEVVEALAEERGDAPINNSMVKEAMKRRDPGFNERAFGYKLFGGLLQEAEKRGLVRLEKNEKAGGYVVKPAADTEK